MTLIYYASWYLSIEFLFLPVNRVSTILYLPSNISSLRDNCLLNCGNHGQCFKYLNSSICLCRLNKFGRKCYFEHDSCQKARNPCENGGQCLPIDDRIHRKDFLCLCRDNSTGSNCQFQSNQIQIHKIPFGQQSI